MPQFGGGSCHDAGVEEGYADLGEVRLHYVEAGEGPLVVLLHGFPEFWFSWRFQIPALVAAGFRVVAPDMRGYNLSSKPRGARAYDTDRLAADVRDLIRERGAERAFVAGHDWGAGAAWITAMNHPEVVERLAILNVPHPRRMLQGLRTPRQLAKSWYILFFQLPWLPELSARAGGWWGFRRVFEKEARPGAFTPSDIERYVDAWSQPGGPTGMINFYRAALRRTRRRAEGRILVEGRHAHGVELRIAVKRQLQQQADPLAGHPVGLLRLEAGPAPGRARASLRAADRVLQLSAPPQGFASSSASRGSGCSLKTAAARTIAISANVPITSG